MNKILTAEEIEIQFRKELSELLHKYDGNNRYKAELSCEDHYPGYAESGEDVRMTVSIPAIYEDGETIRERVEIDLGNLFRSEIV